MPGTRRNCTKTLSRRRSFEILFCHEWCPWLFLQESANKLIPFNSDVARLRSAEQSKLRRSSWLWSSRFQQTSIGEAQRIIALISLELFAKAALKGKLTHIKITRQGELFSLAPVLEGYLAILQNLRWYSNLPTCQYELLLFKCDKRPNLIFSRKWCTGVEY